MGLAVGGAVPRKRNDRRPAGTRTRHDALSLLHAGHERIVALFQGLTHDGSKDGAAARLLDEACRELEIHAQIEEELFYPAVRHEISGREWLEEGEVEHETIDLLIEELRGLPPGGSRSVATATVLAEFVGHHLAKEERRIFPQVRRTSIDLVGLGELLRTRHADILAQRTLTFRHPLPRGEARARGVAAYSGLAPF
jgi:hypothetical protein